MILKPSLLTGVNHSGLPRRSVFLLHQELERGREERLGNDAGRENVYGHGEASKLSEG